MVGEGLLILFANVPDVMALLTCKRSMSLKDGSWGFFHTRARSFKKKESGDVAGFPWPQRLRRQRGNPPIITGQPALPSGVLFTSHPAGFAASRGLEVNYRLSETMTD